MKRLFQLLTVLVLIVSPALAQSYGGLMFSATVQPISYEAIKAPASGELLPFTVREGDAVSKGTALFGIQPVSVYADMDGTIADVYIHQGDRADAAVQRYGAALWIEHAVRYQISTSVSTGSSNAENRDLHVGTPVFIRNSDRTHEGTGVIIAVDGLSFTVEVQSGDLEYNQELKLYRDPNYTSDTLLGRGRLSYLSPKAVTASGTVIDVAVQKGDKVKSGDLLFRYVPDVLEPEKRNQNACSVIAEQDLIITQVNASHGASVQKGQLLALAVIDGSFELEALADECDALKLQKGDVFLADFEESNLQPCEVTIKSISLLGTVNGDTTQYRVYFELPGDVAKTLRLGMHATLEQK